MIRMAGNIGLGITFAVAGVLIMIFPIYFLRGYKKFHNWGVKIGWVITTPSLEKQFEKYHDEKGLGKIIVSGAGLFLIILGILVALWWGWW